jgi:predicted DNA-binding transcriptional regulator AlpA
MINIEKQESVNQNVSVRSRWISEKDVAKIMSISVSTLRAHRFLRKGVPYSKIGRSVRYAMSDVLDYMENNRIDLKNI